VRRANGSWRLCQLRAAGLTIEKRTDARVDVGSTPD